MRRSGSRCGHDINVRILRNSLHAAGRRWSGRKPSGRRCRLPRQCHDRPGHRRTNLTALGRRRHRVIAEVGPPGSQLDDESSTWYRLAYIDGGNRLQVFEHYAATTGGPGSDMELSKAIAWRVANAVTGTAQGLRVRPAPGSGSSPDWQRHRTVSGFDAHPRLHRHAHARTSRR